MQEPQGNQSEKIKAGNAAAVASALWDSGDFIGAGQYYERALREQPSDLEALHGYGRLKLAQNQLAPAAVLLEQAYSLAISLPAKSQSENTLRIVRDLSYTYYRLDRFDLAADLFETLPNQQAFVSQLRAIAPHPYTLPPITEIALPFLGTDPLPIVTVVIGGKEYAFVLDTGSGQVTLDTSFLAALNLPRYGQTDTRLASGQSAPIAYSMLPELTLGEATLRNIPVEVMDIRKFAPQVSGLIGTTLLSRFHVLMDFEAQLLRLRPRSESPFQPFTDMTPIPLLWLDAHLLFAPTTMNTHHTMGYIATGMANVDIALAETTVRQANISAGGAMQGISSAGQTDLTMVTVQQIAVGEWVRHNVEGVTGFFPSELEWRYGFRVGALLGYSLLRQQQLGINFDTMTLYLK